MGQTRVICTKCNYGEIEDSTIDYDNIICPNCMREGTMMKVISMKKSDPSSKRKPVKYYYLASNRKEEWHKLEDSKDGEVEATSSIAAYHKVKEKYKDVIILPRGNQK